MHAWLLSLEPWAGVWAASLWRAAWQGSIAPGLAWIIARNCTSLSPRVVCWVWRAACFKVLMTLLWVQPMSLAVLPTQPRAAVAVRPDFATPFAASSVPAEPVGERRARPTVSGDLSTDAVSITSLVVLAWAAGVGWRITTSARQWILLKRLRCSAAPTSSPLLINLLHEEARRLAVTRLPGMGSSPNAYGPLLTGIWRPMVVMPARIEEMFGEHELRIMLAHELAHLRRRDLAWNWLPTLIDWLLFFNPLVWLMNRSWCEAQEAACDELLIQRHATRPAEYARLLVTLAQRLPQPRATLAAASVLGVYHNLERRIQGMARVTPVAAKRLLVTGTLLTLVALVGSVPLQLVAQESGRSTSNTGAAQGWYLVAKGHEDVANQVSAASLPGAIYARVSLDYKNDAGVIEKYDGIIAINPNTGSWEKKGEFGHRFQVSPDGSRYLFAKFRQNALGGISRDIWLADAKGGAPVRIVEDAICPAWSPDGKEVLYFEGKDSEDAGWHGPTWVLNLETVQARKLPVPETDEVDDWSREGNWLVTVSDRHAPQGSGDQLYVMHPAGSEERRLTRRPKTVLQLVRDGRFLIERINSGKRERIRKACDLRFQGATFPEGVR